MAGGSAITLETNEPLFDVAVALNACGYDDGMEHAAPVRTAIREAVAKAAAATPEAAASRVALCNYIERHTLTDATLNLAQYVSLALYLTPPPQLTSSVDITELPPDATQVVNMLPLLQTFASAVQLHTIWVQFRPQYDALLAQVHDPLTKEILDTNVYLKMPLSNYEGRTFLVLLEPMLSATATNARIYGSNFIVVTSPGVSAPGSPVGLLNMDQIRHTYLHYEVEPLIYARTTAMNRLVPLLKTVQDAPLDFSYKSDIVALITECMIKAVEAHLMDVGLPVPVRPNPSVKDREVLEQYAAEKVIYERQSEAVRRNAVNLDMRQGWVLTEYFYGKLAEMQHDSTSLKDDIGEIVYGMDISREQHRDEQIQFLPEGTRDVVRRAPKQPVPLEVAETKMMKGDHTGAEAIAKKVLADPAGDHAKAHYLLARLDLLEQDPEQAVTELNAALATSRDPRTLAWCHIYLGRLYDMQQEPDRKKAVAEYRAALNLRDDQPDTKAAAESGLKAPFALPRREHTSSDEDDDEPLDPTGKAEKESYKPPPPQR